MSSADADAPQIKPRLRKRRAAAQLAAAIVLLFIFLVGVRGLSTGFKGLGAEFLDSFFAATSNPFVGLLVGLLATTLLQSSSATTSMVVALVAAPDNPLPVENAIPMIMGANMGTTVTNTLVSLGHVSRSDEFQRAFAAATVHDFFNVLAVVVLLPLELATGMLEKLSGMMATSVAGSGTIGKLPNPIKTAVKSALQPVQDLTELIGGEGSRLASGLLIGLSSLIIFLSLYFIVRTLRGLAASRVQLYITRSLGAGGAVSIIVGIVVTVMVQSSSITTSILVPLAGAGIVDLAQVLPITLGANIGTTVTALLAATAASGEMAESAVQIALVHMLFNLIAVTAVFVIPRARDVPIWLAQRLARVATRSRLTAVLYVAVLFYVLPGLLIALSR